MKRILLGTLLFFFTLALGFTQGVANVPVDQSFLSDYVSKNWTTEDGLPGMTITTVIQDKKGYIWIGTYDGLVRFDGVEFTTYSRSIDEKYDFASVRSLYQSSDESIWIGHNDEGITRLSPNGEIKKYTTSDGLVNNKVNLICEDQENNIWVGTASGVCYIKPNDEIVIPEDVNGLNLDKIIVASMYCDTGGRVWVSTGIANEIFVYENKKFIRFTGIKSVKNPAVRFITQDSTGAFWFGVDPHYSVRIKNGEENLFNLGHSHNQGTGVSQIIQDRNGNHWFGMDSGITIIHNGTYTYLDKRNGLSDDIISTILEDNEGNIWIGFDRGGLRKISRGKFSTVSMETSVNAICEDKNRQLTWIGTDNGVYCYKDHQFIQNKLTEITKGCRVRHIAFTKDDELLISSYSDYPQICVSKDDQMKIWKTSDGISAKTRVAIKTSSGDYYLGTTAGLTIIHKDGQIRTLTRNDGLLNHYIMWLYEDNKNQIWVGTNGGGIHILKDEEIIKHYSTDEKEGGLAGNVIFKILNNNDSIWIGTGTGLSKYMPETDSFANITSRNGIGTDSVFQMICDYTNTVWMTTNKGVFSASLVEMEEVVLGIREKINVKYYGASDGLLTSGVTSTSLSEKDSYGRIWFTLVDGFSIYDPIKAEQKTSAPPALFQQYTIDEETFDFKKDEIVLAPGSKRLSLKFTALSYISPENLKFRYKLEGFDSKYSEWTFVRSISYTNLKPGTYNFVVQCQNSEGAISVPTEIKIVKHPYVWQRFWFWIIVGIIIVCLAVLFVQMRFKTIKAKAEEESKFNKAIIGAFANCVDGKDPYTNGHSLRVAKYTRMLAKKLGENPETVEKFYNIAILHDIGKIGIPDAILQKPGKLTDEEFTIMKSHAQRGYEILKDVQIQEDLAAGAHHHHERFDGKGYPDRLAGENIPWVARIIAVADTFDAMSSTRPYRNKLPEDFIINEIKNCAGAQFDPRVVEKFIELYDEGAFKDVFSKS